MNVTITGATGFIGSQLTRALLNRNHAVHVLGRRGSAQLPSSVRFSEWNPQSEPPPESLADCDALIHLAGEPVAQRWTTEVKELIRSSRVESTRHLVNALSTQSHRPSVFVCGSAIGYYGSRGDEILSEGSTPGNDFLAQVVRDWEQAAGLAESLGIRVVRMRTGVVLGKNGGALQKMLPPFRLGLGGRIGSGKQWMSWIHLDDLVGLILYAIDKTAIRGAVNGAAPDPVTNAEFTGTLAAVLHRPAIFPVPAIGLRIVFGEMAEVILSSQRVIPKAAVDAGYAFQYPGLRAALNAILDSLSAVQ